MELKTIQIHTGIIDGKIFCQIYERASKKVVFEREADLGDSPSDASMLDALYKIAPEESDFPTFHNPMQTSVIILDGMKLKEGEPDSEPCQKVFEGKYLIHWGVFCSFFKDAGIALLTENAMLTKEEQELP